MLRAVRFGVGALVVLGLLASCSGGTKAGTPSPVGDSTSSSASGAPPRPELKVPAALPVDGLLANVCSALSAAQIDSIGLTGPGEAVSGQVGQMCRWKSATSDSNQVSVAPLVPNKNGISDIYAGKAKSVYFEPTTIDGYPAVYSDITDSRPMGHCALWVGVTDQLSVGVLPYIASGQNKSNPCSVAERVATAMIEHLKGAA